MAVTGSQWFLLKNISSSFSICPKGLVGFFFFFFFLAVPIFPLPVEGHSPKWHPAPRGLTEVIVCHEKQGASGPTRQRRMSNWPSAFPRTLLATQSHTHQVPRTPPPSVGKAWLLCLVFTIRRGRERRRKGKVSWEMILLKFSSRGEPGTQQKLCMALMLENKGVHVNKQSGGSFLSKLWSHGGGSQLNPHTDNPEDPPLN